MRPDWRPGAARDPAGRAPPLVQTGVALGAAGVCAGVLQFAGALKSVPVLAALPVDLTAVSALLLVPALGGLALGRGWWVSAGVGPPLAAALGLVLWLVVAAGWSGSVTVLAGKLPAVALLGPAMLLAGLLVGADRAALHGLSGACIGIGLVVGLGVALGVATGTVVLGGEAGAEGDRTRVAYQVAGLAIATAGGLAAVAAMERRGAARLLRLGLVGLLAGLVLVPGGRIALLALGATAAVAPALLLWLGGRRGAAVLWGLGTVGLGAVALTALLALVPQLVDALATLERLFGDPATATSARALLWADALRWADEAAPFGLGTAGFTLAAGSGDDRHLHPHNHLLEAVVEGGVPGLLLWLGAFGGGVALAVTRLGRVAPGRAARVVALVLPLALTAMVSTDLGNRMVWFGLGLLLSLGVEAAAVRARPVVA